MDASRAPDGKGLFQNVKGLRPGKSVFDLSHDVKLSCEMGYLVPILCDEALPGDVWEIGNEIVGRLNPTLAPIMHDISVTVHYFFVPYRLLWNNSETDSFEALITGGPDGTLAPTIPTWAPTNTAEGSLWDYLGFPTGVDPVGFRPVDFPRRAYNMIYNEHYRDQQLISKVALTSEVLQKRSYRKDYFTSALPWQQRGIAPALPTTIGGSSNVVFPAAAFTVSMPGTYGHPEYNNGGADNQAYVAGANIRDNFINWMQRGVVSGSGFSATTFNVATMRLAFQTQKWMERQARGGARYTETLKNHFNVWPKDERLQRPEYIGGSKNPFIISEVLQTSGSGVTGQTTPQGTMAGHGLSVGRTFCAKYRVLEYGLIMGIMSVMPKAGYQQGVNRQWVKSTKFDFYFPEFANISEQAVLQGEIYADGDSGHNNTIFGYQGHWDEHRIKHSRVAGLFRSSLSFWHLNRIFASAPLLNQSFIECDGASATLKRIFAVTGQPGLLMHIGNRVRAIRPLPVDSNPGLIDHM